MVVKGDTQAGKIVPADVLKVSALVRERQLVAGSTSVDFGDVSELDTARTSMSISNFGTQPAVITSIRSSSALVFSFSPLPLSLGPMQSAVLSLGFSSSKKGSLSDTLIITSDDPLSPNLLVPVTARVVSYFQVINNDDASGYREVGKWNYSNAEAYGATSRYANITDGPGTYAVFTTTLKKTGLYDIQIIVPKTANASTRARYVLSIGNTLVDTTFIDQNSGSGGWVTIFTKSLPASLPLSVVVSDATTSPVSGVVLRADAIKFAMKQEVTGVGEQTLNGLPEINALDQNHPNPFNPSTSISFQLTANSSVTLKVYDVLGREVATLVNEVLRPGAYTARWDGSSHPSGVYFYHLEAHPTDGGQTRDFIVTKKMLLIK